MSHFSEEIKMFNDESIVIVENVIVDVRVISAFYYFEISLEDLKV